MRCGIWGDEMAEHYIRVTYDGDADPEFTIEINTDDYWAYREIAEYVQKTVLDKQRTFQMDTRMEEKSA